MPLSTAEARFVSVWMASRNLAEFVRRAGWCLTAREAHKEADRLRRLGVRLPVRPGCRFPDAPVVLTPCFEFEGLWVDDRGWAAEPRAGAVVTAGRRPEEGPWPCSHCGRHAVAGWTLTESLTDSRFVCRGCVHVVRH